MAPRRRPTLERRLLPDPWVWFNGGMASYRNATTGQPDVYTLEPFWPSRQHHDFDRVCRRARNARAL
ncbi:hypothetical protein OG711_28690 [Streptomyces uncialis]